MRGEIMGSYLRNTVWYVDFKIKNKRYRLRTDAKSKKEADELVILEKTKKINELSKSKSDIIFSEALTYFLKEYCARALKPKTTERYKTSSKMLNPYFKDMPLSKISKLDIVNYIERRRMSCSDATILRDLRMFSKMIEFTKNNTEWDGVNVIKNLDKKYLKDSETRIRSLSDLEKDKLLKSAKESTSPNLYYEIKFAYLTGLRWNEQFSLLNTDFERTNFGPQVVLRNAITKNGKTRVIPLCDEALDIVEVLLQQPSSTHGYLFHNPDTGDRVHSNRSSWIACLDRSGIKNFRWHDLRHTYATDEIKKGMPIYTLSKLMGHANVNITEKYAHLFTEDLHEAKRKLTKQERQ